MSDCIIRCSIGALSSGRDAVDHRRTRSWSTAISWLSVRAPPGPRWPLGCRRSPRSGSRLSRQAVTRCPARCRTTSRTFSRARFSTATCAGAVHSAALLLRSGIGPAAELKALGIESVSDRPGVGKNYQNHSLLHFAMTLKPQSRLAHADRHYTITSLRFSSNLEGCPAGDLFLYFVGRVSARPFGTGMEMIAAALYVPYSRGSVTLWSRDPEVPPAVSQRLLTDPRDAKRMVTATRLAEALINEPSVRDCFEEVYLLPRDPPLRLINGTG